MAAYWVLFGALYSANIALCFFTERSKFNAFAAGFMTLALLNQLLKK